MRERERDRKRGTTEIKSERARKRPRERERILRMRKRVEPVVFLVESDHLQVLFEVMGSNVRRIEPVKVPEEPDRHPGRFRVLVLPEVVLLIK